MRNVICQCEDIYFDYHFLPELKIEKGHENSWSLRGRYKMTLFVIFDAEFPPKSKSIFNYSNITEKCFKFDIYQNSNLDRGLKKFRDVFQTSTALKIYF